MKEYVVKFDWLKNPRCQFTVTLRTKEALTQEQVNKFASKIAHGLDNPADIVVTYK